ncbi:MAG: NAD(+)/NADH kinase [Elusimicrobiota bacterium]
MKNILVVANKEKKKAVEVSKKIAMWLKNKKIIQKRTNEKLAIVLGGDGMMLKSARELASQNIPLFGVNLGKLGFLAETDIKNIFSTLKKIISANYTIEARTMLKVEISRNKKTRTSFIALNDAVIKNGKTARVINIGLSINNRKVTDVIADGIIISTPTGSTAYSLAAGGPIVHPATKSITITPIAPHTLSQRTVIVPDDYTIAVQINSNHNDVILSVDGQVETSLAIGDIVKIQKSEVSTKLIIVKQNDYFNILWKKLNWGNR